MHRWFPSSRRPLQVAGTAPFLLAANVPSAYLRACQSHAM